MTPERRIHARRILYSPEYLDMGADNGGMVVNLSEGGLRFQAVSPITPQAEIPISFSLGTAYRIDVKAHVVWVNETGKVGGAVFGKLSKDSRSLIREWLTKAEAKDEVDHAQPPLDSIAELQRSVAGDAGVLKVSQVSPVAEPVPHDTNIVRERVPVEPAALRAEEATRNGVTLPTYGNPEPEGTPLAPRQTSAPRGDAPAPVPEPSVGNAPGVSHRLAHEPSHLPAEPARKNALAPDSPPLVAPVSEVAEKNRVPHSGASFSAVPSISGRSRKDASAPVADSASKNAGPLFPPGRAENIFARPSSFEPEREAKSSGKLIVVAIAIAVAAVGAFYVRTHRQQVGTAITNIGNKVAGKPDSGANASPVPAAPSSVAGGVSKTTGNPSAGRQLPPMQSSSVTRPGPAPVTTIPTTAKPSTNGLTNSGSPVSAAGGSAPHAEPSDLRSNSSNVVPQALVTPPSKQGRKSVPKSANSPTASDSSLLVGQSEYQRAEQYLNGKGVSQDYEEAAQWFWRSLEAGYTNAALPLASLYLAGNGVSRSCTQARILLDAAAQKNNAQAIQKLAQLPENCR